MEKGFRLPGSDQLEKKWCDFRVTNDVFDEKERTIQVTSGGKIDEWGFCISEILPHDSLFCLGINPSAPVGHLHTSFATQDLNNRDFKYQREIAKNIGLNFAYWDIFPVRSSDQDKLIKKFEAIADTEAGGSIIRLMFEMTRQAINTARPKAVYVCNGWLRNLAVGQARGPLIGFWQKADILHLTHRLCRKLLLSTPSGNRIFYYNTMKLQGSTIPILLGGHLGDGNRLGPEQAAFAVTVLKEALVNPEGYYDKLSNLG